MKESGKSTIVVYVLYAIFVLLYFVPCFSWPYKTCIPLLILAVFSAGRSPWQITAALFLSALGDLSGSFKGMASAGEWAFIAQMLFFALAHFCYIFYFCIFGLSHKRGRKKMERHEGLYLGMVLGICMIALYNALGYVVPCVEPEVLRICVISYTGIITAMLFTALMTKDWILGLGAVLFVISDFILAWNTFVNAVPAERYLIMVPYYASQAVFSARCLRKFSR